MTQEEIAVLLVQFKESIDRICSREDRILEELTEIRSLLQQLVHSRETRGGATLEELCGDIVNLVNVDLLSNQGELELELQKAAHFMDGFWPDEDDGELFS